MEEVPKTCGTGGFNYCRWAKTLVAIPALPLIAVLGASFFDSTGFRFLAGGTAVALAVLGAVWLDRIPFLMRKVRPGRNQE
jgi:hypothetical protein